MLHNSAQKIADFLCKKNIISKEETEIYTYGYETFISALIDFVLIMGLGFLFNRPMNTFIAFMMFVSVRLYTGGYHAKTYLKCKLTMCLIMALIIGYSFFEFPIYITLLILLMFNLTVLFMAPIENKNKPIEQQEKIKNKKISIALSLIWSFIGVITYYYVVNISATITITAFFITLLMVFEVYRKEAKSSEEK